VRTSDFEEGFGCSTCNAHMWTLPSYRHNQYDQFPWRMRNYQHICVDVLVLSALLASFRLPRCECFDFPLMTFHAQLPHTIHFDLLPN